MTEFDKQAAHSAQQAMTPGFWLYAQTRVQALEEGQGTSAMYSGLRAAVGALVRASGYKPARHELSELWIEKNKGVMA